MKKLLLLILVAGLLLVVGCKAGIHIQDNTYDALGGQVLKIDDQFEYLGDCDPTVLTMENGGRPTVSSGVKTRGDVFVKNVDGVPAEFVIVQRLMITRTNWSWNPGPGTPVRFYDVRYKEAFYDSKNGDQKTFNSYMQFAKEKGASVEAADFYIRSLTRNVGKQSRVAIYYGIDPASLPESVRGDVDNERSYIRSRFDEYVSVVN